MNPQFSFAGVIFDPKSGALTRNGRSSTLRPRAAAVLNCLLERPGELVTKDELLKGVWNDLVVTENSLSQCVSEIRRELGDAEEQVLKTIPRRGYVLEAAVETTGAGPAATAASPRRGAIMVLPLTNIGGDPDQDHFAEGLTEDLTIDIGRMPGAFVIGRGTAQTYADTPLDISDIGCQLRVRDV